VLRHQMQVVMTTCWQRLERDAACILIRVFSEGQVGDKINMHMLLFFLLMQALVVFFTCYFSTPLFFMNIHISWCKVYIDFHPSVRLSAKVRCWAIYIPYYLQGWDFWTWYRRTIISHIVSSTTACHNNSSAQFQVD
jgi:hypothetical protein